MRDLPISAGWGSDTLSGRTTARGAMPRGRVVLRR
jgi:hypothetical protein